MKNHRVDLIVIGFIACCVIVGGFLVSRCDAVQEKRAQNPGDELEVIELKSVPDGVRCFALRYKGYSVSGQAGISCVPTEKR